MRPHHQRVLLYGNCQAGWLAQALRRDHKIAERFELVFVPSNYPTAETALLGKPEHLLGFSHVLWQTAAGCSAPPFVRMLPASCRQIRYPTLCLKWLWPLHAVDPRNQPEKDFPDGRFPYGDRLLMKLLREGVPPADLAKRYVDTDLNTIVNLERFREMSLAELRYNDQQSDISVLHYIETTFQHRRLFAAVNHPTVAVLSRMAQGLTSALLGCALPTELAEPADGNEILGNQEIPLHPQVAGYFKLAWAKPGLKWRYGVQSLSLEEYIRAYGEYTAIPFGNSPQLFYGRARLATDRGDRHGAKLILLQGLAMFPRAVELLYSLGGLHMREERWREAEQVFRYAIAQHPGLAALYCELGIVLRRRDFAAEAARMFETALRIDPQHKNARLQLTTVSALNRNLTETLSTPAASAR